MAGMVGGTSRRSGRGLARFVEEGHRPAFRTLQRRSLQSAVLRLGRPGPNNLDDERAMRLFTPRNPKSPWSRINKGKVARLTVDGRMAPPASGCSRRCRRTEHGQLATRSQTWLYSKTSPRCWGITRPPGPSLRTSRPHTRRTSFVDKIRPNVGNPDETHHPDSRTRRVQSDGQSPQRTGPRAVASLRQFPAMKRRFRLIAVRAGAHWAARQFSGRRARSCSS